VLLQAPGVSYDSAISNPDFHVRNEYANVQYRINGIQLPDGVSALGPVLETGFIGNLNLLDGAAGAIRAANRGRRRHHHQNRIRSGREPGPLRRQLGNGEPSIEYGGGAGQTQYFLTGRYLQSEEGLENAMPTQNPIHDRTTQEKFFGYGSTLLGDSSRLTYMTGAFVGHFQIPDVVGQEPLGDFGSDTLSSTASMKTKPTTFSSASLALQTHATTSTRSCRSSRATPPSISCPTCTATWLSTMSPRTSCARACSTDCNSTPPTV
jgi:hypothetical protein